MKSGWSAPPEVFQEKSLLEIEEEKRKNVKHKKQAAPKQHDFPTLGKFYRGAQFLQRVPRDQHWHKRVWPSLGTFAYIPDLGLLRSAIR